MAVSLPTSMMGVEIAEPGGPEVLRAIEMPLPVPGPGEVLVKCAASGVNRPDIFQRKGAYPPPKGASPLPGLEIAGTVVAHGPGTDGPALGTEICALVAGGGYAEYCTAAAALCLPVPAGLGLEESAALPETFFTVWTNLFDSGRLAAGEALLVHGGSSGIGTTAIQIAKAFGARVIATAGSAEKCAACLRLGADVAVNYREEDFGAAVAEATEGKGADLVLDMVGGDYMQRNFDCLALEGRVVSIAFLRGGTVTLDLQKAMIKRQSWTGTTLRPRTVERKAAIARALEERVWPLLASGAIAPVIHARLPLAEAAEAHRLMESSAHIGKILLIP